MIPHSLIGRLLLILWLATCVAVLVFAFVQREIHDVDIAFIYLMLFLTFPLGYVFAAAIGAALFVLNNLTGIFVPGGFMQNLVWWVFFVGVGYFQWFVAVPWLFRKLKVHLTRRSSGTR